MYSLSGKSQCRGELAAICVTVGSDYIFRAVLAVSFFFNGKTIDLLSSPLFLSEIIRLYPNVFR